MDIQPVRFPASIDDQVELATRARLAEICARAWRRVGQLASQFARADGADRERILAEMELERWLAENCEEDLL